MMATAPTALGAINYLRPSNQLVLLLQKGQEFPAYPMELSGSLDEKTWYARMEALQAALYRYWSWVEKALFALAFVASVTVPWPIISAVTRYIDSNSSDGDANASNSTSGPLTTANPSATRGDDSNTASAFSTITASAVRYAVKREIEDIMSSDDTRDTFASPGDGDNFAGYRSWDDGYSSDLRWAAIGILIGIITAVWLPWIFVTIRNTRRLRDLIESWNEDDEKLGPMRALTWSLNKAPAFSNAKILLIGLPPGLQQQPSIFHANAYPPSYGYLGAGAALPDYHDHGFSQPYGDDKADWYAPPQAFGDQKAHMTRNSEDPALPGEAHEGLERINSRRHSLSHAPRNSRDSYANEGEVDRVSEAYAASVSYVPSDFSLSETVQGRPADLESGLDDRMPTRPQRSSSRSSRLSGRAL